MAEYKPYVCTLDANTQKKAEKELYEDPKNRQGAIDSFREWISQQKHIKCPTDDVFLLGFLRGKHFSQLEARNALEFYMDQRRKLTEFMTSIDTTSADMDAFLDLGIILWLGRDDEGRHTAMFRTDALDYSKKSHILGLKKLFTTVCYQTFFGDEITQVHGCMYYGDFHKYTMAKDMKFSLSDKRIVITLMQKTFPARVKGLTIFNTGAMMDFLLKLITPLLNDKLKQRLSSHAHGLEDIYKKLPMRMLPDEYLPDDYTGPSAGSLKSVIANTKKQLQSPEIRERIRYLSSDTFTIDMTGKDKDAEVSSFRKLSVD